MGKDRSCWWTHQSSHCRVCCPSSGSVCMVLMKLWLSVPFCLHLTPCSRLASATLLPDLGAFSVQLCGHRVPSWRVASQPTPVALILPSFLSSASGFSCSPWGSLYVQVTTCPSLLQDLFTGDCLHLLGFLIMLVFPISLCTCVCVCVCVCVWLCAHAHKVKAGISFGLRHASTVPGTWHCPSHGQVDGWRDGWISESMSADALWMELCCLISYLILLCHGAKWILIFGIKAYFALNVVQLVMSFLKRSPNHSAFTW